MATKPKSVGRPVVPGADGAIGAAALLGERFALPPLADLGVPAGSLDPLFDDGVLVPEGDGRARFADGARREAIVRAMAWSRRRRLHGEIARVLEARRAPWEEVAVHHFGAQAYREARAAWVRAAEVACRENRYAEAFEHIRRAMEVWPADQEPEDRRRVLVEMARCAKNCGDFSSARLAWEELLEGAAASGGGEAAIEAHRQLGDLALLDGDPVAARRHLERAARLAETGGDPGRRAKAWLALASFLADRIRLADAAAAIGDAARAAEAGDDMGIRCEVMGFRGLIRAMRGDAAGARADVDAALGLALEHNLTEQVALAYRRQANIRDYAADYHGERDAHLSAIAYCRRRGVRDSEHACLGCLSYAFFRTGEWKRALATSREVLGNDDTHPAVRAIARMVEGCIAAFRGQRKTALATIEAALSDARRFGLVGVEFFALWARADLDVCSGDPDAARERFRDLVGLWRETEDSHDVIPGLVAAMAFLADRGDRDGVSECTDIVNAIDARHDNAENKMARQAALAETAWCRGDAAGAAAAMRPVPEHHSRNGNLFDEALARSRLARFLHAAGDPDATVARDRALGVARRLGLRPLIDRIDRDGAGPDAPAAPTGAAVTALTPRQNEVLALIAAGWTNKEIAARLHLSPRTVEMHVARLLERLNCRTRSEAVRRATEIASP